LYVYNMLPFTKLEALGWRIPPPRHVLPVPPYTNEPWSKILDPLLKQILQ